MYDSGGPAGGLPEASSAQHTAQPPACHWVTSPLVKAKLRSTDHSAANPRQQRQGAHPRKEPWGTGTRTVWIRVRAPCASTTPKLGAGGRTSPVRRWGARLAYATVTRLPGGPFPEDCHEVLAGCVGQDGQGPRLHTASVYSRSRLTRHPPLAGCPSALAALGPDPMS
jgi:hypothetical protein